MLEMDEVLLLETVERYVRGEMNAEEKAAFEALRKQDAELDQQVVEHIYFFQGIHSFGATRSLKHNLQEVEAILMEEGVIGAPKLRGGARVAFLWKKYQRNVAVAASIAGFVSLLATGIMVSYTKEYSNKNYQILVDQLNKTNREVSKLKSKEADTGLAVVRKPEVDFRATGFLIDGKGYLVTNAHVISKMKNIYIENRKGDFYSAEALFTDKDVDLVILKITDTAFKAFSNLPYSIKKGNSDLGEQFFTLGFPRNEIVYGEGYLSAKSGSDGDSTAYQLTVSANPGNSGGPVINRNGEIIGIITAKDSKADGVVYAAKSMNIINMLEKLKKQDDKYTQIKIPSNGDLKGLDRVQQVKKMEEFVFMVVGN